MSNAQSAVDLLFGGTRQRVLAALLLEPDSSFHVRALARLTGSHAGTLLRELEKLAGAGLVRRREQGNQVLYQAERGHPLFDDLAAIFRKTHGAADVLRKALAPLAGRIRIALIFGSVARGAQTAGSDIDLLVIGELGFTELVEALYAAQQALAREINPVLYSPQEFSARLARSDPFARELLAQAQARNVVILTGAADDLAELAVHQAAPGAQR